MTITNLSQNDAGRLQWRCRRGMLELDLLLNAFLLKGYASLNTTQRSLFEELLVYSDQELLPLLLKQTPAPHPGIADLVEKIRHCAAD